MNLFKEYTGSQWEDSPNFKTFTEHDMSWTELEGPSIFTGKGKAARKKLKLYSKDKRRYDNLIRRIERRPD